MGKPVKKGWDPGTTPCIHSYGSYQPIVFAQQQGIIEERVCKKCGRQQRRRAQ